ncbi:MAG: pilus assembly protein PilP [Acidobacteria bacterium]|nr:pilus assembly protein PilP [Acidobacteriota bacterium]MDW7984914.1 hypothetical protein [Acidobacteriota bacterium]
MNLRRYRLPLPWVATLLIVLGTVRLGMTQTLTLPAGPEEVSPSQERPAPPLETPPAEAPALPKPDADCLQKLDAAVREKEPLRAYRVGTLQVKGIIQRKNVPYAFLLVEDENGKPRTFMAPKGQRFCDGALIDFKTIQEGGRSRRCVVFREESPESQKTSQTLEKCL